MLLFLTKDVWLATVARKFLQAKRTERNFVAVGDVVVCKAGGDGIEEVSEDLPSCTIEARKERMNKISRISPLRNDLTHVLAANIDQLVIVASLIDPKVKWGLIDRYLTLAESENLNVSIVLTKMDLIEDEDLSDYKQECLDYVKIYKDIGYDIHMIQANIDPDSKHESIDVITKIFKNKVCLVSGHSGVGKSSIVNLLDPEIEQEVEDDDIFYKGRHTTTYSSLIKLGKGGYVVDSPGIRSFLIEERSHHDLAYCYKEFRPLLGKCKYRECRHIDEPECAIREASENGVISSWRYKSYLGILLGATGREGRMRDMDVE
jgi:ribosome biogenesis GTPase